MDIQFSIIIPTHNRASLIRHTLLSLLEQTFKNYEILVIDDGGNDNTKEVVEALNSQYIKYYWKENGERGAARNYGAALAKGIYINFFDSDDIAYPNHLETAELFIKKNQDVVIFHTSYDWKNANMKKVRSSVSNTGELNKKLIKHNILSCNNVFIRKTEFDKLHFSEDRSLSGTEDWLLWLKIACRYPIIGLSTITSAIIEHDLRSMQVANGDNTLQRTISFDENLKQDNFLEHAVYKSAMAEMYYLTSLYYFIEGKKSEGIKFAIEAIKRSPLIILNRRTLAIIKYLLK